MNISKIQKKLTENGLDAMLLFTSKNIRYATSFFITDGAVAITPSKAWMFTDSRYIEAARLEAKGVQVELFGESRSLGSCIKQVIEEEHCERIGAEEQSLSHGQWLDYEKLLGVRFVPAQNIIAKLRAIKEPEELASIEAAQRIAERALEQTLGLIKPGVMERDIAAELTYRMLLLGAEGNSFDPICITGAKTSMPHGVPGEQRVKAGDFVTMDFGCLKNGYCSDMTRTVAVGSVTEEMKRVYDTVLSAQLAGIAAARAGVVGAEVHKAAAEVIARAGYGQYFDHGFGHGVGLDIHETPNASPSNKNPLPAGAVISAEPGIYIPGKFGVRIEDMLFLTPDGNVNLTKAPKELLVL